MCLNIPFCQQCPPLWSRCPGSVSGPEQGHTVRSPSYSALSPGAVTENQYVFV